jgi:predicted naringenin-chalcone synthase
VVPAEHRVDFDTVQRLVATQHASHPRLAGYMRIMRNTQVATRYWVRPAERVLLGPAGPIPDLPDLWRELDEITDALRKAPHGDEGLWRDVDACLHTLRAEQDRRSELWRDVRITVRALEQMAVRAADEALDTAGLAPGQIDCVIVSSVTGYVMPGLDVHLVGALGLRPDVRRIPVAQVGCAGGAYALARAWEQTRLYPGSHVLVAAVESFSSVLHPSDTSVDSMIYRALGGDGAAACIVSDDDDSPGLHIDHPAFEYVLDGSTDYYRLTVDENGLHFPSTDEAPLGAVKVLPELRRWLGADTEHAWPVQFAVSHHGAPKILDSVADGLLLSRHDLRHAWASLEQYGNMSSATVLDVLGRTYIDPPKPGSRGVLVGFGPGFAVIALKGTWIGKR